MSTQREVRPADVHRLLDDAEQRYADADQVVRDSLARFRSRLRQVEERTEAADDRRWANYASALDRGLDELDLEISRAAAEPADPDREVLAIHTSALELAGWRMRFTLHEEIELTAVRGSVALAESELERARAARVAGTGIPAGDLERAMAQLRQAARQMGIND